MLIRVHDVELRPVEFKQDYAAGILDLGPDIRQQGLLHADGSADLVQEDHGDEVFNDIRLRGKFSGEVEMPCARCIEPIARAVQGEFDLLYRPNQAEKRGEESAISEAETEISFYDGEGVLLEDAIQEQVILSLPAKAICRSDCKGICPHCGKNRNQDPCDCGPELQDTRWDALRGIKLQ